MATQAPDPLRHVRTFRLVAEGSFAQRLGSPEARAYAEQLERYALGANEATRLELAELCRWLRAEVA